MKGWLTIPIGDENHDFFQLYNDIAELSSFQDGFKVILDALEMNGIDTPQECESKQKEWMQTLDDFKAAYALEYGKDEWNLFRLGGSVALFAVYCHWAWGEDEPEDWYKELKTSYKS